MKNSRPKTKEHGVAMVSTLIILSVLAIVAVALMQSVTTDRTSARSGADYYKAQLAADAGAAFGRVMLADLIRRYPDSVTGWQNIGGGAVNGTNNEATLLYVRAQSGNTSLGASPAAFGPDVTLLAQPLVSRIGANASSVATNLLPLADVVSSVPYVVGTSVNINATNDSRTDPFVGSRSSTNPGGALVAPITAAQWIYLTNASGQTNARFAFWMEDESFKVNANIATDGPRGTTSLGTNAGEARIDGAWGASSNSAISKANFASLAALRGNNPYPTNGNIPSPLTAMLAAGISDASAAAEVKFLTTTHSAGLDLSRGGFKRFNINTITNGDKREALDRIIAAITNTNAAPNFGQRFYRSGANASQTANQNVTQADAAIYLQKIAANIYDYLDNDDQPTIINNDGGFTLKTNSEGIGPKGSPPGPNIEGANSVAAVGVENLPRLQEYAVHARIRKMQWTNSDANSFGYSSTNTNSPASAEYEIWIDHYFEFWNPGTRDIVLPGAGMAILDQPAFVGASGPLGEERDITNIPIGNITFPAGGLVVMTTAAPGEESLGTVVSNNLLTSANLANAVLVNLPVAEEDRKFIGSTSRLATTANGSFVSYTRGGSTAPNAPPTVQAYDRLFEVAVTSAASAGMIISNSQGLIESFYGLTWSPTTTGWPLAVSNGYIWDALAPNPLAAGNNDFLRASSLRGNRTNDTVAPAGPNQAEGDPRTLNEQLEFKFQNAEDLRTSFYMTLVNAVPGAANGPNFGSPNTYYISSTNVGGQLISLTWTDTSGFGAGAQNAPLFVRNGAMQSIGELGHITDPARTRGGLNERFVRGGGRTLRVGQPEIGPNSTPTNATVWWYVGNGNQTNASRTWTSWRLADIFTTTATNQGGSSTDGLTIRGLLNPNGALRDNGAALRAALFGLAGEPSPTAEVLPQSQGAQGTSGMSFVVNSVVTNVLARLTNVTGSGVPAGSLNPFWERGEISELRLLNNGSALGVNMSNVFDRGREELVRRSIEMITPRGSVFTVYTIGQSLQLAGNKTNVLGSVRVKQTFELTPQFATGDAFDDNFNPVPTRVTRRFSAPTNYIVRVLSTSYD